MRSGTIIGKHKERSHQDFHGRPRLVAEEQNMQLEHRVPFIPEVLVKEQFRPS